MITITITEEDLKILNALLMEAPYKISAPVIQHINESINHDSK